MSWRALVVGDVHLRTDPNTDDTLAALCFATALANSRDVDAVIFGGDIYEKASTPHERALFAEVLADILVPTYGVRGNHDAHEDLVLFNHIPLNRWVEAPEIVKAGPVDLLLVPWADRAFLAAAGLAGEAGERAGSAALRDLLRAMVSTRRRHDAPLILNAHLQVLGALSSSAQPLIGKAVEAVLGDLLDLGLAAGFVSHVHRPQELAPNLWVPGSIVCHDFGEEDEQKRVGILTVEDSGTASVEWVPVPCRRWATIEAFAEDGVLREMAEIVTADVERANLRYRYRCTEADSHLFDHEAIRARFAAAHSLKIVAEVERTARVRAADVAAAKSAEEKLRAWGVATETPITPALVEKLHTLESEEGSHA